MQTEAHSLSSVARMFYMVVLLCAAAATPSLAQSSFFTSLASFNGMDGAHPYFMSLVQGTDGNFYGTTWMGGTHGAGAVFKVTPTGSLTTLHDFCSEANCADGSQPYAGLVESNDGNLYGETVSGGTDCIPNGCGTIYKITPSGALTTLHSFDGSHGSAPAAALLQATDGNFYGTTFLGGPSNAGTIFKMTPAGTLTTLYNFCSQPNCTDGIDPEAQLVQAADGNFYGTTRYGGAGDRRQSGPNSGIAAETQGGVTVSLVSLLSSKFPPPALSGEAPQI